MVVRRFITIAFSSCLVLAVGIAQVDHLFAQDAVKKVAVPPPAAPAVTSKGAPVAEQAKPVDAAKPAEPAKTQDTKKAEAAKASEPTERPIPPEVQAKIEAARKAVAEMIVAAQDAGLVETSIDPPPILDILITGRATDARVLKAKKTPGEPYKLSPEVMAAWFTGYGRMEGINYVDDVRILPPSEGLKQWYDQRASSWSDISRKSARRKERLRRRPKSNPHRRRTRALPLPRPLRPRLRPKPQLPQQPRLRSRRVTNRSRGRERA